jgi:transglutaminase/protease-like cytokinesis protein 3
MNPQKRNFLASLLLLFLIAGVANPMFAQAKSIIGKHKSYKKTKKSRNHIASKAPKTDTKSLAQQITIGKKTDADKAKSIFIWITTTIEYDNELRLNRKLQEEIYTSEANVITHAVRRKKALCGGYAFLFKQLCEDVGVKAEIIHGFTNQGNQWKNNAAKPEHTWNAVHINGAWQLLDITWAVSHGSRENPQWFWYGTAPSDFIKTHLPQEKKWQLTQGNYSK